MVPRLSGRVVIMRPRAHQPLSIAGAKRWVTVRRPARFAPEHALAKNVEAWIAGTECRMIGGRHRTTGATPRRGMVKPGVHGPVTGGACRLITGEGT